MINPNDLAYINEREDFHSDKCGHCMSYVNDDGDCTNKFCSGIIPAGISCETDFNSLQVGDTFVSSRGLVAVIKGIVTEGGLHKFFSEEIFYNVSFDGSDEFITPLGVQNLIKYR